MYLKTAQSVGRGMVCIIAFFLFFFSLYIHICAGIFLFGSPLVCDFIADSKPAWSAGLYPLIVVRISELGIHMLALAPAALTSRASTYVGHLGYKG